MRYADEYGFYELNPFPGCNQVVVSNHAFIYALDRGKGNGYKQHQARLAEARRLGYSYIICTVRKENSKEISILEGAGWKTLDHFWNLETEHDVVIYGKVLN
jgi:predicted GNAT superfamily acetyltransferase